jgi:iron complex outermembrane receptor protein
MKKKFGMGLFAGAVSTLALCTSPSSAQSGTNSDRTSASSSATSGQIQDIVVTAERREQNVQKAPLTIQVLTPAALASAGVSSAQDLSRITTGVSIGVGSASTQIFIRGVGDFSFSPLSNPGVAFNVDGVYIARPDGLNGNFYDIARVEVLKGPQGTLYGRNANGGSINLITNDAALGKRTEDLSLEVGNYGLVHTSGAINLPVGDNAAARLAFNIIKRDGYLSDGTSDDIQQAARLRVKWDPAPNLTIHLNGDYSHIGGNNGGYVYLPTRPGANPWEGVASPAAIAYRNSLPPYGPFLDPAIPNTHLNTRIVGASVQADWNLGFATLTLLPAYRHNDINTVAYPGFLYEQPNKNEQKSLEARLGKSSALLTWVVGSFAFNEKGSAQQNRVVESEVVQDTEFNFKPDTTAFAAFGQATMKIFDGFRLIGGLRYTHEKRSLSGNYIDNRPIPFGPGPGTVLEQFDGHASFGGITYKAGAEYDIAPQNMVYATASTGFKSGGLNETIAPEASYRPEKLFSLEVGSHNRFFNNRLQINLSAYRWKYQHLQDQRVTFDPLDVINLLFFNVGNATIKGATADIIAKPTRTDTLGFSVEYASSRYDSFHVQVPTAVFFPGSIGCPTSQVGSDTVANCAGYQVARVPKWTGTVNYSHEFSFENDASLTFSAAMKFSSSRWIATDFIPAERAPAYGTVDLDLTFSPPSKRYTISGFARNVGQKAYYLGGFEQPFVPGLFAANIAPPRTYGMRVSFKLGD